MAESQVMIRIDREAYLLFKAACWKRRTTPTAKMRAWVTKQMAEWGEPMEGMVDEPREEEEGRHGR